MDIGIPTEVVIGGMTATGHGRRMRALAGLRRITTGSNSLLVTGTEITGASNTTIVGIMIATAITTTKTTDNDQTSRTWWDSATAAPES
jgi:hypothetical protein